VTSDPVRAKDGADHVRPAPNLAAIDIAVSEGRNRGAE